MFFAIIYSIAILGISILVGVTVGKKKKRLLPTILFIESGIFGGLIAFLSLTLDINLLWFWVAETLIITFAFLATWYENVGGMIIIAFIFSAIIFIGIVIIYEFTGYCHETYAKYSITVVGESINVDCEIQGNPYIVHTQIINKLKLMEAAKLDYVEGIAKLSYMCHYPYLWNNHEKECRCSIKAICKYCEKYIYMVEMTGY